MKNKIALLVLMTVIACQTGFAATKPVEKLKRGGEGIFTAPLEHCNVYRNTRVEYGVTQSVVAGIFVGTFMAGKRIINGVYDVATFPVNFPSGYGLLFNDSYETALQEHRALNNNMSRVK